MGFLTSLPTIPPWVFILTWILFILYLFFGPYKHEHFAIEVYSIGTVFAGLIIGFILVFAMQKYDLHISNRKRFVTALIHLQRLTDGSSRSLLRKYIEAYLEKEDSTSLETLATTPRTTELVSLLEELATARFNQADDIPNSIWYTVYISIFIISILVVIDIRISKILGVATLILIWLPLIVVYYLYQSRENETLAYLRDKLTSLEDK